MNINEFTKRNLFFNQLKKNSNNIENNEFINEWEFYKFYTGNDYCICGVKIIKVFIIKNIYNNKLLIVGSNCI